MQGRKLLRELSAAFLILLYCIQLSPLVACAKGVASATAERIRQETLRPVEGPGGSPLPLASHWNGRPADGFSPAYLIELVERGHFVMPVFKIDVSNAVDERYFEEPLKRARELGLPISLISTQWEGRLLEDRFFGLGSTRTPCLVDWKGKVHRSLSPVGPLEHWATVGKEWTSSNLMKSLQRWYPDPPFVLFVSNNEAPRAKENQDRRKGGVDAGFGKRYTALLDGMRDGLTSPAWRENSRFIGYGVSPSPELMGRWRRWKVHYPYQSGKPMNPWLGIWDGGSPPYYTHNWSKITDYTVWSPQVEAMNWVPFLEQETYPADGDWWHEISVWDGDTNWTTEAESKRTFYLKKGQEYSSDRYAGMVQFGLWLTRPRVVREFRHHAERLVDQEPYFLAVVRTVDRIHRDPVLRRFWRLGRLVPNAKHLHPYQVDIPAEFRDWDRWYLLDTNVDPPRPWSLSTEIPVFSIARVLGKAPERQWLVYAHSPLGNRDPVEILIPEYKSIEVSVRVSGSFYLVDEKANDAREIK